jgi:hypothetical protein
MKKPVILLLIMKYLQLILLIRIEFFILSCHKKSLFKEGFKKESC